MLFRSFVFEPARHLYHLLKDGHYRRWCWQASLLGRKPRFTPCRTRLGGVPLDMPDAASFLSAYREIFVGRIYQFPATSAVPRILDLGANIGLSVMYFKSIHPEAEITAYEADPTIFSYLQRNLAQAGICDVTLVNQAVWDADTTLHFHAEGADGGHVADGPGAGQIEIAAVDVRKVVDGARYDFLKMDIEGAEERVLPALRGRLGGFRHVFVEYHSRPGQLQRLAELLALLADEGFRVDIQSIGDRRMPFMPQPVAGDFDLQLNIFANREPVSLAAGESAVAA